MTAESDGPDVKSPIDLAREADFALGALRVSPSTREVLRGAERELLEPRIMQVLVALFRAGGRVVSRDELIARCWEGRIVGEDAINRAIGRLRRLSEVDEEVSFVIETIPRVGYRLMAGQAVAAAVGPEAQVAPEVVAPGPKVPGREARSGNRRALFIAVAVAIAAAAAAALFWIYPKQAPPSADARVAVLPFDTLDGKAGTAGFGKAVAEQIITTLTDIQVPTVSREDTASIGGADRDSAALKNGAEFILSGSVQNGDNGLRVTVHLDHASTHATVWTKSYDQGTAEPLEFQAQIADGASDVTSKALKARENDPVELNDPPLSLFLKLVEVNRIATEENLLQQRVLAQQLIAQAPKFSKGYSQLAVTYALLTNWALPDDVGRLRAGSQSAATTALALNPKDADGYLALSLIIPEEQWAEREAAFRRGLSVVPSASLQAFLARVLSDVGRLREALALSRGSLTLDPLSAPKSFDVAQYLVETGHVSEGLSQIEHSATIWPSHPEGWLIHFDIMASTGHIAAARTMLDTPQYIPVTLEPQAITAMRAYLDDLQQKTPAARLVAENSIHAALAGGTIPAQRGMQMFATLGDVDSAFALAKGLFRQGTKLPAHATLSLFLTATDSMRRDPRFMPLAAQAGLVNYWQTTGKWPDFCAQPGLPYDCRAAARALSSTDR